MEKIIYLVRHGNSDEAIVPQTDFERVLSDKGIDQVTRVGRSLAKKGIGVDCILSSPALRALQTANLIAKLLNIAPNCSATDDRIYQSSLEDLMDIIHALDNKTTSFMLVGHNPALSNLIYFLTTERVTLSPSAVYAITLSTDDWQAVDQNQGKRLLYLLV